MSAIKIFEDKKIRALWLDEEEDWCFSVVDVIEALTDSIQPRKYWNDLKKKLKDEGSELSEKIGQLKMKAKDGKYRLTDVVRTKDLLRLIQSIPSPKAEPFKIWLAEVGKERLDEIADPEKAILRGADYYRAKGYTNGWINQRLQSIKIRKELTDEWKARGLNKEKDYAILTNEMTKAWSGLSVSEYKRLKGLRKESLRDNMTNIELVLNMLAEVTTTAMSKQKRPSSMSGHKEVAREGGEVANTAKIAYEEKVGKKAVSSANASDKKLLEIKPDED